MPERELIDPVKVQFAGRDADEHRMDALLLGKSLSGIARVYNSVGHLHFHGQLRYSEHSEVRVQAGPPKPGTIWYVIYMFMVHGTLPVYPEILFEAAEFVIPNFVKAIIAKKTGQTEQLDKTLEIIARQGEQYHELTSAMMEANKDRELRSERREDQLLELVNKLVDHNRRPLVDMAAPVGKTVNELKQIPAKVDPIVIDAAAAESLKSPEEIVVGESQTFRGTIIALDTKSGTFKLEESETGRELRGKITDPALYVPQNIYSHALDTKEPVSLIAKPTLKENGDVHKLFVSDANGHD